MSWNSARFLPGCLDSLAAQTHPPHEIIVVDNGSVDGSVEIVRSRERSGVRLIALGRNAGFCAANNEGFASASGDAVLFLNPDVELEPEFLDRALAPFASDERIGSVAGKLLRFDGATVDSAGQCLARSRRIVERGYGRRDTGQFEEAGYVFSVCGAAALYRRETIEDLLVGGELFDPDFFAFSEDLDLGWRARNAGWRAYYEPRAIGRHFRGGSGAPVGFLSSRAAILRRGASVRCHILKNRYLTLIKNDRPSHLLRDLPFVAARESALLGVALVSGPAVWAGLARSLPLVTRAMARRRLGLATVGRWGPRRTGVPLGWTGERLLREDPGGKKSATVQADGSSAGKPARRGSDA